MPLFINGNGTTAWVTHTISSPLQISITTPRQAASSGQQPRAVMCDSIHSDDGTTSVATSSATTWAKTPTSLLSTATTWDKTPTSLHNSSITWSHNKLHNNTVHVTAHTITVR